ncbi:MAG TPA: hypothetical protein VGZ69_01370 [Candidatus Rhabdochlamydia sp.]|nr:hypothetical protein [Candidatus Rhabdochlamydia sp.]
MKVFKIINSDNKAIDSNCFNIDFTSKGRITNQDGFPINSNCKDPLYKIIAKVCDTSLSEKKTTYFLKPIYLLEEEQVLLSKIEENISYIKNNAALKPSKNFIEKDLIAIAKLEAQKDGLITSKFIRNYRIRDKKALVEIAKIAAKQSAQGFSIYMENYGITNQQSLVEIAKIIAQQKGQIISQDIEKYGITDEKDRIEIAKIVAQNDGEAVSAYIENYNITDEQARIEIAKIVAQNDGEAASAYIENYNITDEQARIEIAKIVAKWKGGTVSQYIANYKIKNLLALYQIAKTAAQNDGWLTSKYITNYKIRDEQAICENIVINIEKLAAQNDVKAISQYIVLCKFINRDPLIGKEDLIKIEELAAQNDVKAISQYIADYKTIHEKILDEKDRIEIAKIVAQNDGEAVSAYIENYNIIDEQARIEIAKITAKHFGGAVSTYIANYNIIDEKDRIEIAKLAAQSDGGHTSAYIANYNITDEQARIEIAKITAKRLGEAVSAYIENYNITDEQARIEIAKLAAQNDGQAVSAYIEKYKITDQKSLMQIFILAIQSSILHNSRIDFWEYLSKYTCSKEELKKYQLIYTCFYGIDCMGNAIIEKVIHDHTQSTPFPLLSVFDQKMNTIEEKISKEQDSQKKEKLQKQRQRVLLYSSLVSIICQDRSIFLAENQQNYFIEALEHRNRTESALLMLILAENFAKPRYFSKYEKLVDKKKHLILPMIFVNQWLIESPSLSNLGQKNLEKITDFLKGSKQRSSLRDAKGFLPHLLQVLIAISYFSTISSEQKIYLLNQCLQSALPTREKEWEERCKRALDIIHSLSNANLLNPILDALKQDYTFEQILPLFHKRLNDILLLDMPQDLLCQKYLRIEKTLRIKSALINYASSCKNHQGSSISKELQRLVTHILEGSVKQERYQTINNPHLQKMKEDFPQIFQVWQTSEESIEVALEADTSQTSMNFFDFLKQKILMDEHFPGAPLALLQYLEEESYSLEDIEESDQQIVRLCKELCDPSVNVTQKLPILKKLSPLIDKKYEFKNDVDSLYKSLTASSQQKSILIVDSDDWQDLLLSGTEIIPGSCQRINGDPNLNVCLMAYVLDGKNRILCIKDPATGRILARCIFRLLFKDNQPVLFQERIYPTPCKYEKLLNEYAKNRAKKLGLELFTCNLPDNLEKKNLYILESLGSCSPYEYVDAGSIGKTNGIFSIDKAQKVDLST